MAFDATMRQPVVLVDSSGSELATIPVASVGSVSSGATDSGAPVKVGGRYNSTMPTFTDGQRGDVQLDAKGSLLSRPLFINLTGADGFLNTSLGAPGASALQTFGCMPMAAGFAFNGTSWDRVRNAGSALGLLTESGPYLLGRATADAQIKSSAGFIHTVSIAPLTATPTAGLLTIYNNTAESGTVVYAEWVFATTPGHTVTLDVPCSTGIYVGFDGTLANVQVTVAYR